VLVIRLYARAYFKVDFGQHIHGREHAGGDNFVCPLYIAVYMTFSALSEEELGPIPRFIRHGRPIIRHVFHFLHVGTLK